MPVLFVYGLPSSMNQEQLQALCYELRESVAGIKELENTKDQVSVFFPTDRMESGLGEEIIIFVDGLFAKKKRTNKVRERLAVVVVETTRRFLPPPEQDQEVFIECFVRPFQVSNGYDATTIRFKHERP